MNQILLDRFFLIAKEKKLQGLIYQLSNECDHINALFMHTIWIIFPFMSILFAYFLFDISGDQFGITNSRAPAIAFFFLPTVIYFVHVTTRAEKYGSY
jgi:phosphate/sulfate permease